MRTIKRFTQVEIQQIYYLRTQGKSANEISIILKRHLSGVIYHLRAMDKHIYINNIPIKKYVRSIASQRASERFKSMKSLLNNDIIQKFSNTLPLPTNTELKNLSDKIEVLEQHMEILLEILKEKL